MRLSCGRAAPPQGEKGPACPASSAPGTACVADERALPSGVTRASDLSLWVLRVLVVPDGGVFSPCGGAARPLTPTPAVAFPKRRGEPAHDLESTRGCWCTRECRMVKAMLGCTARSGRTRLLRPSGVRALRPGVLATWMSPKSLQGRIHGVPRSKGPHSRRPIPEARAFAVGEKGIARRGRIRC